MFKAQGVTEVASDICTVAACEAAPASTTELGVTVAVKPVGKPVTARFTVPKNPFTGATEVLYCTLPGLVEPAVVVMVKLAGEAPVVGHSLSRL